MHGLKSGAASPQWSVEESPSGRFEIRDERGLLKHSGTPQEIAQRLAVELCKKRIDKIPSDAVTALILNHNQMLLDENRRLHHLIREHMDANFTTPEDEARSIVGYIPSKSCGCGRCFDVMLGGNIVLHRKVGVAKAERLVDRYIPRLTSWAASLFIQLRKQLIAELDFEGMKQAADLLRRNAEKVEDRKKPKE